MRSLRTWQDKIETEVAVFGSGPPVVYLHGPWGLRHDLDFLARLAQGRTVYAPKHPGTTARDPEAVHQLDDWLDLIVYYGELLDRLGLGSTAMIGHSYGGMLACEFAAANPERVSRLVLIDPVGLWRDDAPVKNWMVMSADQLRAALFADPAGEPAREFFAAPGDGPAQIDAKVGFVWSQACTGKFVWPIPDKGLKKRIHRIAAPTLLVWGKADRIVAPVYAEEFAGHLKDARIATIAGAGHVAHLEQPAEVARLICEFLG